MAKKTDWTFEVRGTGPVPLDMLRYDGAFPSRQEDVNRIQETFEAPSPATKAIEIPTIRLRSTLHGPTVDRWRSFDWLVTSEEAN